MEVKALGFNHAGLTVHCSIIGSSPRRCGTAIAAANAPDRMFALQGSTLELAQVVRLSNCVAEVLADGQGDALAELHRCGLEYRGLTERDFDELLRSLETHSRATGRGVVARNDRRISVRAALANRAALVVTSAEVAGDIVRQRTRSARDEEQTLLEECNTLATAVQKLTSSPPRTQERVAGRRCCERLRIGEESALASSHAALRTGTFVGRKRPRRPGPTHCGGGDRWAVECAVSVLCVEVDRQDELLLHLGPSGARQWVDRVFRELRRHRSRPSGAMRRSRRRALDAALN